jgi:hypothetical protein
MVEFGSPELMLFSFALVGSNVSFSPSVQDTSGFLAFAFLEMSFDALSYPSA